jgi:hypothetical protein
MKNLPVPQGPRARLSPLWIFKHGTPAAIIIAYRLIPAGKRAGWNNGVSTSHKALAAVLAPGGGWRAFRHYTTPRFHGHRQHGFAVSWAILAVTFAVPGLYVASWTDAGPE